MTAASIQDRYGTEAEEKGDNKIINTLWKFSPTSYDNEKIVVLPYAQYSSTAVAQGTLLGYQQYKINSVYDPDLTGAGSQPLGRDTWSSIYNFYKVLETHVKVKVTEATNISTSAEDSTAYPSLHGWMADITANPPAFVDQWIGTVHAGKTNKQQRFSPIQMFDVVNGRGQKPLNFEYHWDASQFDTSVIDNAKNEWTPVGSDPANINYFSLLMYNPSGGVGDSRRVIWHMEISYLVAYKQINRTLLNTVN